MGQKTAIVEHPENAIEEEDESKSEHDPELLDALE